MKKRLAGVAEREGWEKLGGRTERSGAFGIKEAKKERKSCLPAWRRGKAGKNWADGLREAVCLAFKEAKKERKRGPVWRRGKAGKNWADGLDGLREAVCLAFKEAKKG